MRLSAFAKKYEVSSVELMDHLKEKGFDMSKGLNTKLLDEHLLEIKEAFGLTYLEKAVSAGSSIAIEEEINHVDSVLNSSQEVKSQDDFDMCDLENTDIVVPEPYIDKLTKKDNPVIVDKDDEPVESFAEQLALDNSIDVIKVQKINLEGLTIKGKIDLPEPKVVKKDNVKPEVMTDKILTTKGPKKRITKRRRGFKDRDTKALLAKQKKRKEREHRRIRQEEEKKQFEAKKNHYVQKINLNNPFEKLNSQVTSGHKKTNLASQNISNEKQSLIKRFWDWMNT